MEKLGGWVLRSASIGYDQQSVEGETHWYCDIDNLFRCWCNLLSAGIEGRIHVSINEMAGSVFSDSKLVVVYSP